MSSHLLSSLDCTVPFVLLSILCYLAISFHFTSSHLISSQEQALFQPATLFICEGTHTFSLTIIANVGYRKENLKVSLQKDMLVIHGYRDPNYEPVDDAYHCPSRRRIPLTFTRYIPLPDYVDPNSVSAVYHKWKLHVYISKRIQLHKKVPVPAPAARDVTSSSREHAESPYPDTLPTMQALSEAASSATLSGQGLIGFQEVNDFSDPAAVSASHDMHINCDHLRDICHSASPHTYQLTDERMNDSTTMSNLNITTPAGAQLSSSSSSAAANAPQPST
jgi:HSP20 family molecular chaperone IbpA